LSTLDDVSRFVTEGRTTSLVGASRGNTLKMKRSLERFAVCEGRLRSPLRIGAIQSDIFALQTRIL